MTVYIVGAARTPIGSFLGNLSSVPAPDLGAVAIKGALGRSGVNAKDLNEVIMGCVLPAGVGQAPARQAMKKADIPNSVGAMTINKVCGSGLKAVMVGSAYIKAGEADLILAGGMESMSNAPYYATSVRTGAKMGHQQLVDGMIHDGLWDPYNNLHMGNCAEQCAAKYNFSREEQDAFATRSYERALATIESGAFNNEIEPVHVPQRKGDPLMVDTDEEPGRGNTSKLGKLRTAFQKEGGTITAGNASSINDGAAALILASEEVVKKNKFDPLFKIVGYATHSQEPEWFTTAPVGAMQTVLKQLNLTAEDIDLWEINEAFAVVTMAAEKELGLDPDKVNVYGGAVSLGHPIGASGARILVTLLNALQQKDKQRGLASLCIGGGEAVALVVERV